MKGTAARGRTVAEDVLQRDALRASAKQRAENMMVAAQHFAYRFDRARALDELTKLSATWTDAAEDRRVRLLVSHLFHKTTHRAIYNRATITTTCNVVVETDRGRVTPVECGPRTGGVAS